MKHPLGNHQQQVVAHCNPNLCVDSVARCSIERLDVQTSFYEFKERLHIPTLAVKFCDGDSWKIEIICNKCVNIVCSVVLVYNHAYSFWIALRCHESSKHNILITDNTCTLVYRPFSDHLILHVILCPRDKESMLFVEKIIESLEVNTAFIHQVVSKSLYRQFVHYLAVMDLAFRKVNKGGYTTSETKQGMHLEGSLLMMEFCPRTKLEAKLDCTTVEGINHIIYIQTIVVFVIKFSRLLDKMLGQVVINAPVLGLIQIGKRGAWDKRKTGVVQLTLESRKGCLIGTKTLLRSELCEAHHHELVTAGELDLMSVAIVPCDTLAEDVLWEQRHDLSEYTLTLIHLICNLHYYQMQRYKIKSSKNFIDVNH